MHRLEVGVIGAGIAGIATAIRLAVKGHKVTVFEANDFPGGKLSEFKLGRYRFDAGPSLFTMPHLVDELFDLAGETPIDHFEYITLSKLTNYFYEDGTRFSSYASREQTIESMMAGINGKKEAINKAFANSATLYDYLGEMFMYRSLHDWRTYFSRNAFRSYRNLHKMDFFRSMHRANSDLIREPKLVQFFDRYATYNGSDPYQTPATMNIIPHLEYGIGAFFPNKGMYSITTSLVDLARRLGVDFRFSTKIKRIRLKRGQVAAVEIEGGEVPLDRVVSNMDIVGTYTHLLPDVKPPRRLLSQPKSSSALIFYWGVRRDFPELDLHNILFSQDYKEEFDQIFRRKSISKDPTVYINISSKLKHDDAPKGAENWFTMINVPHNDQQDWDRLIADSRQAMLEKISRMLEVDIAPLIEEETYLDPRLIELRTGSSQGALYGNSSNNKFAAFLRHPNFSRKVKGLYFCGGSVHPGGGIPMALSSAKIVDRYFR